MCENETTEITPIPAAVQPQNDGGPNFDGHEGEDDNRTTRDPLGRTSGDSSGDGELDSAEAVGMKGDASVSQTQTQNAGGGL